MAPTKEELARMGKPHPDLLSAIEKRPFPDLTAGNSAATALDVRHNRAKHLAALRHLYLIPGPIPDQVKETEHQVLVRDGFSVRVRIYVPVRQPADGSPLVVMMHEGGWCMDDLTDEDLNCRMFTRDLGAVCVNVEYRLAPEHVYPTGVHDCQDVVRWCARIATPASEVLPADPRLGFVVGGASAGGNFAAVMCQMGRDDELSPPLTAQYLCCGSFLWHDAVPDQWKSEYGSRSGSKDDPVLHMRDGTDRVMQDLKPDTSSPMFSPLLHPRLEGLPPTYFQVGGLDPLRDESLLFERVLREQGVPTKLDVYDGFGHMFWTNWPEMQQSEDFVRDTLSGVRWLLETGKKS